MMASAVFSTESTISDTNAAIACSSMAGTDADILEIGGMLHFIGHSGQVFSASKDRLDAEGSPFHWFQFRLSSTTENCWKPILS